jgi:hypothetical protein
MAAVDEKAGLPQLEGVALQLEALAGTHREQAQLVHDLCLETVIARWVWKSGQVEAGLVPWDEQVTNTLPENYQHWGTRLHVRNEGIYELDVGFFSADRPDIEVIANQKTVATVRKTDWKLKGSLQLAFSFREILFLERNSDLQVAYSGAQAEGFLGLRRL